MSAIEERHQRARMAYYDSTAKRGAPEGSAIALEEAIETATRVQITPEAMRAAERENVYGALSVRAVAAALRELGFEVVD